MVLSNASRMDRNLDSKKNASPMGIMPQMLNQNNKNRVILPVGILIQIQMRDMNEKKKKGKKPGKSLRCIYTWETICIKTALQKNKKNKKQVTLGGGKHRKPLLLRPWRRSRNMGPVCPRAR